MFKRLYYIILQRLFELKNRRKPCQGKVYMFHDISDLDDTYSIRQNSFEQMITFLSEKRKIVDADELINSLSGDNVVLTFDDAYASVYYNAYPLLKELDVPYYIFICEEYLNQQNYLSEDMIKEMLSDSRCIIGSHNTKHVLSRFVDLNDFNKDVQESKKNLENLFNVQVDSFAFPYGSFYACSQDNIDIAEKYYEKIFMTYNLPYNSEYKSIIPRININQSNYRKEMQ